MSAEESRKPFPQGSPLSNCDREQSAAVHKLGPAASTGLDQGIANGSAGD